VSAVAIGASALRRLPKRWSMPKLSSNDAIQPRLELPAVARLQPAHLSLTGAYYGMQDRGASFVL